MVAEGEHLCQDFKYAISDPCKIARSLSAFANHAGGRLLIGVKDNGDLAGVRNEEDVYIVEQAAQAYCRPPLSVDFQAYSIDASTRIIVATVEACTPPVEARDASGRWHPYYRVADENIAAHPLLAAAWRLRTNNDALILSDRHTRAMGILADENSADIRDLALTLGTDSRMAAEIVTELVAAGALSFRYIGGCFRIVKS